VARLAALAEPQDDGYQSMVVRAIGRQRRPETLELLAEHLDADDPRVRAAAVLAVAEADPRVAAEIVRPLANDESPKVVRAVASALVTTATLDDVPALVALAQHADSQVRSSAAEALGALDDPAVVPLIADLLDDRDFFVRSEARRALRRSGLAGSEAALAGSPCRNPIVRRSDARTARNRCRARERRAHRLIAVTDLQLVHAGAVAIHAGTLLALTIELAGASVVIVPITLLLTLVFGLLAALALSDDRSLNFVEHDRARARAQTAPSDRDIVGKRAAILPVALHPRRIAAIGGVLGVAFGLELLLPTGGVLAATVSAGLLVFAAGMLLARRRILSTGVTTLTSIDAHGRTGLELWLAPTPSPTPDVRATAV
jgi:hypothetical protein